MTCYKQNDAVQIWSETFNGWSPGVVSEVLADGSVLVLYRGKQKLALLQDQPRKLRPYTAPQGNGAYSVGQAVEVRSQTFGDWTKATVSAVGVDGSILVLYSGKQKLIPLHELAGTLRPVSSSGSQQALPVTVPHSQQIPSNVAPVAGGVAPTTAFGYNAPAAPPALLPPMPMAGMETVGQGVNDMLGQTLPGDSTTVQFQKLLKNRHLLKDFVSTCFNTASQGTSSLDLNGLRTFTSQLCVMLSMPPDTFGDLETQYDRFDFSGSGQLNVNECYKLAFFHIMRYWHIQLNGAAFSLPDVPQKSLQSAGYSIIKELGQGSQGVVRLATNAQGKQVCIKSIRKDATKPRAMLELQEEYSAMKRMQCPRMLKSEGIFQDLEFYYLATEACHGGDFATVRSRAAQQGVSCTEEWWRGIFKQCLDALAYMHANALMHCDIKEPNMMLRTTDRKSVV